MKPKAIIENLFDQAGIQINGYNPWDIRVYEDRFYSRVLTNGSLGLGESYMEGWWDCSQLDQFIGRILKANLEEKIKGNIRYLLHYLSALIFNLQSLSRSEMIARKHYNIGNDLFFSFLDPYNQYSCAYFQDTEDLNEGQLKKLDLICKKLSLKQTDHVLDIGCGWGGFARYAAEHYGCRVTGINISEKQLQFAKEYCRHLPVELHHQDYRQLNGKFDKILSVGMFEHVGWKNYKTFMNIVFRCLKEDGIFLLHTIGRNTSSIHCDPWIHRYIFPNGMLPSIAQISKAAEGVFVIEDIHNLGPHYYKTLMEWNRRFQASWHQLSQKYDQIFKRMWEYYLLSCAAAFNVRHIQVWQIVMTKVGRNQPQVRFV